MSRPLRMFWLAVIVAPTILGSVDDAQAQLFHRHHHTHYSSRPQHYHDSAGHIVDRNGHHVDSYGRHTGAIGVYDNHSVPNTYGLPYTTNYGGANLGIYTGSNVAGGAAVPPNLAPDFGLPIRIICPESFTIPINYSLNGVRYTLQPGQYQTLANDRPWTIQFDRGGEYGFARYGLTPGAYEFSATERGWELLHDTTSVPSANSQPPARNPAPTLNRAPSQF